MVLLFELFVLVCCSGICCYFGCQLLWFCYYWFVVLVLLCYCFCCGVLLFWFRCLFLGSWGGFVNWGDKIRIISAPLLDFYLALLLGFGNGGGQENLPRKRVEPYRGESSLPPPPPPILINYQLLFVHNIPQTLSIWWDDCSWFFSQFFLDLALRIITTWSLDFC